MAFLIDIEGIDGSGKGTQAELLRQTLTERGYRVELISFPRYGKTTFARGIADFLNGRFGTLEAVDPFLVSLLYAGDRFESRDWLRDLTEQNQVVILDRYVPSNMAHQGSKRDGEERRELLGWIDQIEYGTYDLPRPNLVLWLDLPVDLAHARIAAKKPRDYTAETTDLQESNLEHLRRTREVYESLAGTEPGWNRIETVTEGRARTQDEIRREIESIVIASLG